MNEIHQVIPGDVTDRRIAELEARLASLEARFFAFFD